MTLSVLNIDVEVLVDVFKVSRARIRRVLLVLANENLVKQEPNRGAFVWRPSVAEARRRIELQIASKAANNATKSDVQKLRKIISAEQKALKLKDEGAIIRLSGEFHTEIATIASNPILSEFLRQMISRCYLILATYQRTDPQECSNDDHTGIGSKRQRKTEPKFIRIFLQSIVSLSRSLAVGASQLFRLDSIDAALLLRSDQGLIYGFD